MARVSPSQYKPILSYHFKVQFTALDDGAFITYGKGTELPAMSNNTLVADHGNTYINIKGKTRWNPLRLTMYSMSTPDTTIKLWDYLQTHHKVEQGEDKFREDYVKDILITLLNPDSTPIGTWTLVNAMISEMNWGTMDWSGNDIVTADVTFVYDYAKYS